MHKLLNTVRGAFVRGWAKLYPVEGYWQATDEVSCHDHERGQRDLLTDCITAGNHSTNTTRSRWQVRTWSGTFFESIARTLSADNAAISEEFKARVTVGPFSKTDSTCGCSADTELAARRADAWAAYHDGGAMSVSAFRSPPRTVPRPPSVTKSFTASTSERGWVITVSQSSRIQTGYTCSVAVDTCGAHSYTLSEDAAS